MIFKTCSILMKFAKRRKSSTIILIVLLFLFLKSCKNNRNVLSFQKENAASKPVFSESKNGWLVFYANNRDNSNSLYRADVFFFDSLPVFHHDETFYSLQEKGGLPCVLPGKQADIIYSYFYSQKNANSSKTIGDTYLVSKPVRVWGRTWSSNSYWYVWETSWYVWENGDERISFLYDSLVHRPPPLPFSSSFERISMELNSSKLTIYVLDSLVLYPILPCFFF